MLDEADLCRRSWTLEGGQGILSPDLWLVPGGFVGGLISRHEHRWVYADGRITFFNQEGAAATVLERQPAEGGRVVFAGSATHGRPGANPRRLWRDPPRVGCFLRTHFWAPTVQRAYERVAAAWGGDVGLMTDQTNPFQVPEGIAEIPHTVGEFIRLGLPCHPIAKRMLWFNGDYVFYSLALQTDVDFFVVCEYDLAINAFDLRGAVARMVDDGMDAVGPGLGRRGRGWGWHASQLAWLRGEIAHAQSAEDFQQVLGVFFPFVAMSRRAALHLYARRLEIARLWRTGQVQADWPHCESFIPTELHRAGFRTGNLTQYVPAERMQMSVDNVRSWQEVEASDMLMIHPVVDGARFARKIYSYSRVAAQDANISEVEWMRQQLGRPMSDEDRAALVSEIEEVALRPPSAPPPSRKKRKELKALSTEEEVGGAVPAPPNPPSIIGPRLND